MRYAKWLIVFAIIGIPGTAWLIYKPDDPFRKIDLALGDRTYADAAALIEQEIAKHPKDEDSLWLKLATAHELGKNYPKAIAALDQMPAKFPNSPWSRKAKFRKAEYFAAMRQYDKAQEIAGEQVRYLVSNERKLELASVYLKYAEEYFQPRDVEKKPDYEKARVFFEKALELGISGPKALEIRYRIGLAHFRLGQHDPAIARFEALVKEQPKSEPAAAALYHLGLAREAKGEMVRARIHFRDLLADYADTTYTAQAAYEIAKTYGIPNAPNDESLELGVKALREFIAKYPDHPKALRAHFEIAQAYQNRGRAAQAVAELRAFIEAHAAAKDTDLLAEAKILLGQILRGQRKYAEAIDIWTAYLKAHPTHNQWDNIQREIITTRFQIAVEQMEEKKYEEARASLAEFLIQYPIDGRAPEAAFLLGMIEYNVGAFDKAIAQWEKVVSKYAGQEAAKKARFHIAQTYEQKLNNLAKAFETYKKSAEEGYGPGQQRFAELTKAHLAVITERILRSDEKPQIHITTRNIEKLKLAAYRIDMETYFRRHYTFRGVENLDITLIEPEKRWEYAVPNYEKYRFHDALIDVPLQGPGVWAINVTDDKLEATTMYVVSDLAIVTKSTRKEVFAFAQNAVTKKPYPNATILVSDGTKILQSGQTNNDGVFQQKIADLKTANEARFFAFDGAQYASNDLNIQQLAYVEEIQPKAYIFTDKPAYRPGQMVHAAGIVRKAKDGRYSFEPKEPYTCDLVSARGDLLERRAIALDDFGMFNADFVLADQAPLGQYTINVYQEKGPQFSGNFQVQRYKLENIELKIDLPQTVFLRGEKVKGRIIAKYYYGEPVKDHKIVYQIPGFFIREARTTDTGVVNFEFDTREFVESQALTLQASLPEDNIAQAKTIFIATHALNLNVETLRDVYLAGESFDVKVKPTDLAGEKTTATVSVHVIKLESVRGQETEREISTQTLTAKGEGAVSVKVADGGHYLVRATTLDRFGTPVSATKRLFVSGKEDTVRLRVLADRQSFKVGEEAKVDIVARTTDTVLGLITYEADGIIKYEIRELKNGENPHAFRMADAFAPNVVLSVAAIHGNQFFTAEKDFEVKKGLTIDLASEKEQYEPGATVNVAVKAYDQEGKPARAKVVLSLVDQALFALYGEALPDIKEFFYGARRGSSVRTESSVTFRYTPPTRAVADALRREEERLAAGDGRASTATALGVTVHALAETPELMPFTLPAAPPVAAPVVVAGTAVAADSAALAPESMAQGAVAQSGVTSARLRSAAARPAGPAGARGGAMAAGKRIEEKGDQLRRGAVANGANVEGAMVLDQSNAANADLFAFSDALGSEKEVTEFGGRFQDLNANGDKDIVLRRWSFNVDSGVYAVRGPGDGKPAQRETLRSLFLELAYWNPTIVTDEKGEAKVPITLPDNTTTWRLRARGVTADTVVGDGSDTFVARRDFFLDIRLPRIVTEGNTMKTGVAVHNLSDKDRQVEVSVFTSVTGPTSTTAAGDKKTDKKTIFVKAHASETVPFEREIAAGQSLRIEAAADSWTSGVAVEKIKPIPDLRDRVARDVPIRPWGIEISDSKGGTARDSVAVTLQLPAGRAYTNRSMDVTVGPVVEYALFDLPPMGFGGSNVSLASRVIAKAALVDYLARTGDRETARYRATFGELQQLAGQLAASRREDGAWAFAGTTQNADPFASALALRALARAKATGVTISDDVMAKAIAFLKNAYQQIAETENAKKADLLYTLALLKEADFTHVNRLYRLRNSLDNRSLALVTLTLVQLDRAPMGREVAQVLAEKGKEADGRMSWETGVPGFPWASDPLETTALAVEALARSGGFDEPVAKGVAWLMQNRASTAPHLRYATFSNAMPVSSAKGVAAMTEALALYFGQTKPGQNDYTIDVLVNTKPVRHVRIAGTSQPLTIEVPPALLADGANRVDVRFNGRGDYAYSAVLSGFTREFKTEQKAPDFRVERYYEPAPMVVDGKVVARGFSVVQSANFFRNAVTQLPAGEYTHVSVGLSRTRYPVERRYFVLTEPIPEGATVLPNSVTGNFQHYEIGDGEIVFYIGECDGASVAYDLYGHISGQYKILPSQMRNAYDPSELYLAPPYDLAVLKAGEKSPDKYELTPDEYYNLALIAFEKKQYDHANELLETLMTKWQLHPDPYKKAVETLLAANIERDDPNRIVKYFEVIYERFPQQQLTFEQTLRVARAYDQLREFERAFQVYRGMAESSFLREANIAGELRKQGEFLAAVRFLHDLIHTYPDLEVVKTSLYSLSQLLYAQADKMDEYPELREKKITRESLIADAIRVLDEFNANYPENPQVDEAAFSMVNAYLDLEASNDVVALSQRFQKRYPKSSFLDGYQYVEAYGHFINGRYDEALALLKRVSTEKYPLPGGGMDFSDNRDLAVYIMGQIYHAQARPVQAIAEYDRVKDKFADAREAIAYFKEKRLELPEVADFKTSATPYLAVTYRNVKQLDLRVFRVDLMKLYLTRRNLNNIADVNLAGIQPYLEKKIDLGEGIDYMDKKTSVPLDLKEKGAFLVMIKGDELNRSSMILRTNLGLDIQQDVASGRVRANVYKTASKVYIPNAQVKVIGEGNPDFISGQTDLRGVFIADDIKGRATVIARVGDEYAFFRGNVPLQNFMVPPAEFYGGYANRLALTPQQAGLAQLGQQAAPEGKAQMKQADLRQQLREWNAGNQGRNNDFILNQVMTNTIQQQEVGKVKF